MKNHREVYQRLWFALFLLFVLSVFSVSAEEAGNAKNRWPTYKTSEEAGFSTEKLWEAKQYWKGMRPAAAAIFLVYKGKALVSWGKTRWPFECRSMRKSFLSALYGIHVDEGHINLQKTLAELNIMDDPLLTEAEMRAKVIHLLKSRSGVYHEAAAESPEMRETRPLRGSHPPNTFWYYNNWDFNALGTIFEQETGTKIFEEFKARIANPIGMQDFTVESCYYKYELQYSIHPAYPFRMTARDRARFGQLFLQEGRWQDTQIVPKKWVRKSTTPYSDASGGIPEAQGRGYGYMWWTWKKGSPAFKGWEHLADIGSFFYASGYGGHVIVVMPKEEMVFVQVVANDLEDRDVPGEDSFTLLDMIFAAKEFEIFDLTVLKTWFRPAAVSPGTLVNLAARVRNLSTKASNPTKVQFYLSEDAELSEDDLLISTGSLPKVKPKKRKTVKLSIFVPPNTNPGEYYLIAYVDKEDANFDPHPDNNIMASKQKIIIQ